MKRYGAVLQAWNQKKLAAIEQQDRRCGLCKERVEPMELHHINPLSKGGSDKMSNLVALCHPCHVIADRCEPDVVALLRSAVKKRMRRDGTLKIPKWRR